MRAMVAVLLLGVELGSGFGEADAEGRRVTASRLEVEMTVEVQGAPDTVVAHLINPGEDQETVALADRGGGAYGGLARIRPVDLVVVFEALRGDHSGRSRPVSLTEMGLDPGLLTDSPTVLTVPEETGLRRETRQWGWLGLGLGAAALALLALWVLGGERKF